MYLFTEDIGEITQIIQHEVPSVIRTWRSAEAGEKKPTKSSSNVCTSRRTQFSGE